MFLKYGDEEHNAIADEDAEVVEKDVGARPGADQLGELGVDDDGDDEDEDDGDDDNDSDGNDNNDDDGCDDHSWGFDDDKNNINDNNSHARNDDNGDINDIIHVNEGDVGKHASRDGEDPALSSVCGGHQDADIQANEGGQGGDKVQSHSLLEAAARLEQDGKVAWRE
ncbi:hypothetical protein ElyMa_006047100 [Elysia marginata]|uniref:Uncharacterized protein n=1 Tax=Elysia marginata TaxID=1093978 RepID=A0AAV4GKG1_9GAST|nr:hypothetical protein ElyMa_006047100 [Elysia marginata]